MFLLSHVHIRPDYDQIKTQLTLEWVHINSLQYLIVIEL